MNSAWKFVFLSNFYVNLYQLVRVIFEVQWMEKG